MKPPRPKRRWTKEERLRLFQDYFDRHPGVCPICASEVRMQLEHEAGEQFLLMKCSCGNSAMVNRSGDEQAIQKHANQRAPGENSFNPFKSKV